MFCFRLRIYLKYYSTFGLNYICIFSCGGFSLLNLFSYLFIEVLFSLNPPHLADSVIESPYLSVRMSGCLDVCLHVWCSFSKASHWHWYHMISSRPLIGPKILPPPFFTNPPTQPHRSFEDINQTYIFGSFQRKYLQNFRRPKLATLPKSETRIKFSAFLFLFW